MAEMSRAAEGEEEEEGVKPSEAVAEQGRCAVVLESRWVDWRCKPIKASRLGGWRGAFCTIVSAGCGYFAFSGIYSNLVLYLIREWKESNVEAANDLTNLLGTLFFTTVIGAFLGDAYWGRLWTVVVFQLMFAAGCVLVGAAATLREDAHTMSGSLKSFLFGALYITALGSGSYEPAIASLGADQFNSAQEKATYFNWMFVACNVGQLPALTILTYIENKGGWALGFWISSALVLVSLPIFLLGAPYCRQYKPGGNPLLRLAQVVVAALRKLRVTPESDPKLLFELPGDFSIIQGCLKIQHRDRFRWLDKAATITEQDKENKDHISPWRLCTVTQVEEVKGWLGMIPVLIFGAMAQAMMAQSATIFVEQGAVMDGRAGNSNFTIPPGSLQIVGIVVASALAPIYDYFILPLSKRWTKNAKGITSLQRMGAGLAATMVAMIVAALVEKRRLQNIKHGVNLSIFWLIPQNAIVGVSSTLLIVGQMEFFYTEISESVRSLGICLTLVCRGLGNFISSLLVTIIASITSHRGNLGWIPHDLNSGHLDYFYWFLASLMFITLLLYIGYAHFYTYIEQPNLIDDTGSYQDNELSQK
ncbi:hypothetical protein GOP47_0019633 [Adiantum capillus-veneris]|uniref:Uncharacterized protein n=1 Tax=Adiantum capillus-veneris TaxID=13818 RepID=A0A9D4UCE0_ADICA|nr:hypothetical protein GOP47_0019633 [Adiantum capillus-veneris]